MKKVMDLYSIRVMEILSSSDVNFEGDIWVIEGDWVFIIGEFGKWLGREIGIGGEWRRFRIRVERL